ncbi:MAG TPA: 50S ribosomal protein L21 [Isosphaeraceae bacterium]|jgi:large subunit ribosomal protein L21|nr:50S ribosomal protein L21 [Isosphaeraceae bacterium]
MYAIFEVGSHQYRVREGDTLILDLMPGEPGSQVEFEKVLLVADSDGATIGQPLVAGARVRGVILDHFRDKKLIIQKFRRRKNERRRRGHRQPHTAIQVTGVVGQA